MNILEKIRSGFTFFDGGTGTMLQQMGLKAGELPETWNLTHREEMIKLHLDYINAGSDIINANTFGATSNKFSHDEMVDIINAGIENVKEAIRRSGRNDVYVAFDTGSLGILLKPYGQLGFEEAVDIFAQSIKVAVKAGVDLINIETMTDIYETKALVIAAKENCDLPIFVSNAYDKNGKTLTGADVETLVAMLDSLHVDAIGLNCSFGPEETKKLIPTFYKYSNVPISACPNAGLPEEVDGKMHYNVSAEDFAECMTEIAESGAVILGGCCGTTPEYIRCLTEKVKNMTPKSVGKCDRTVVSSYNHVVEIGNEPVIIGERINPTGKKLFKQALKDRNIDYILNEGFEQENRKSHILDVNVGLPEIDENAMLTEVVEKIQAVIDLPLQIDTSDITAMEHAMRIYNGKPMVNSVNGKKEIMDKVFPLVKKYGGVVTALTLDEKGIPETADGRIEIAKRIYKEAEKYGIEKRDIIIDPLTLTVSTGSKNAEITLEAVKGIKALGGKTVLGVSNISFGLPERQNINSTFYTMALNAGLDAAIINPKSDEMMRAYYSYLALSGQDKSFEKYIGFASENAVTAEVRTEKETDDSTALKTAVIRGVGEKAAEITERLLIKNDHTVVINDILIPALNEVGKGFETNKIFLPQLLMSADTASKAFDVIKKTIKSSGKSSDSKGSVVIATVKGDIHDIGKNIVKVLLENYGFNVIDLGKDVPPEEIVKAVVDKHILLCGLSALMTSTVPSMQETIKQLNISAPWCRTVVGGAVLTKDYADKIGADFYSSDAMETVRCAEKIFG